MMHGALLLSQGERLQFGEPKVKEMRCYRAYYYYLSMHLVDPVSCYGIPKGQEQSTRKWLKRTGFSFAIKLYHELSKSHNSNELTS
jgi:hypothetical protein